MKQETVLGPLDGNTLKELARVICGDDHLYYRRGFEIAQFLENAGWHNLPEYDGEYRSEWTLRLLMERRENPSELEKVLLRLADAREYLEEPEVLPTIVMRSTPSSYTKASAWKTPEADPGSSSATPPWRTRVIRPRSSSRQP